LPCSVTTIVLPVYIFLPAHLFFYCHADHRDLHSFPTRRSSDLRRRCDMLFFPSRHQFEQRRWMKPTISSANPLTSPCARYSSRRSEEHTSELQSRENLVCRLLLEKKKKRKRDGDD